MENTLKISKNRLIYNNKSFCFEEDKESIVKKVGSYITTDNLLKDVQFDYFSFDCLFEYTDNFLSNLTLVPTKKTKGLTMNDIKILIERALSNKGKIIGNDMYMMQDIIVKLDSSEYEFTLKIYGVN